MSASGVTPFRGGPASRSFAEKVKEPPSCVKRSCRIVSHPTLKPGVPYPLGATYDGKGVNFAVFSSGSGIELCLFNEHAAEYRVRLTEVTNNVWHGYVPDLAPGARYAFRAHGDWNPKEGLLFNPAKLLMDPYAKAFAGQVQHEGPILPWTNAEADPRDSAPFVPRCVVVSDDFDWGDEQRPENIWRRTVVYEAHVKGLTARHPDVPPEHRGTYLGLTHPAVIEHLKSIGITSLELLPVHEPMSEGFLVEKGLTNYWGYNTLGFFAPAQRLASTGGKGAVHEFKTMVKALHAAGIEVILDVVPNHTCEGNHLGPTLCWKGLDNREYYWLQADRAKYRDFTGCGNSLHLGNAWPLKLVLDSLRHWVTEFHVDGFRFDLATTLARTGSGEFANSSPFLTALHQDPVLSRVKLIAEPWDLGHDGYRLGQYPSSFAEWNDRYRDTVRHFWRGDPWQAANLGYRLTGSSDLFKLSGRRPTASINFITAHDGYSLRDLVSYQDKHNTANLENNRDGNDNNASWNCGVEGDTEDPDINALRARQQRNFFATLFLSVGTPMINAGDELSRSAKGNNNTYCQDNELSWHDWSRTGPSGELLAFVQRLAAFRHAQPVLQRRNFFLGQTLDDSHFHDLAWFNADGSQMEAADWAAPRHFMCWFLGGDALGMRGPDGHKLVGDSLLIYLNAAETNVNVTLPEVAWGEQWEVMFDTALQLEGRKLECDGRIELTSRSVLVLRLA